MPKRIVLGRSETIRVSIVPRYSRTIEDFIFGAELMIWLVRHGESEANAGKVTSDYSAISLTARGRDQAVAIAAAVAERPALIGVSEYLRARQTAAPLLLRYPGIPLETLPVHEFTYLATNRAADADADGRRPFIDAYWSRMDPDYSDGEGAESFVDFVERGRAFLDRAAGWTGLTVVFTHEQFIRVVMVLALYGDTPASTGLMRQFLALRSGLPVPNAAIVGLERRGRRWWVAGIDESYLKVG